MMAESNYQRMSRLIREYVDQGGDPRNVPPELMMSMVVGVIPPTLANVMKAAVKKAGEAKQDDIVNKKSIPGPLFVNAKFTSSAGLELLWKIECDTMGPGDWECLADRVAERFTFRAVHAVPKGKPTGVDNGARFADALAHRRTEDGDYYLIADDVFSTGGSMDRARERTARVMPHLPRIGVTAWNRTGQVPPQWIASIFTFWG